MSFGLVGDLDPGDHRVVRVGLVGLHGVRVVLHGARVGLHGGQVGPRGVDPVADRDAFDASCFGAVASLTYAGSWDPSEICTHSFRFHLSFRVG